MTSVSEVLDVITKLNRPRAFAALIVAILFSLGVSIYETYTHSFRLERAAQALAVANAAERYGATIAGEPTPVQLEIYEATLAAAHSAAIESGFGSELTKQLLKFAFGFLPWVLMALVFISAQADQRFIGMFGALTIGALAGGLLSFVPEIAWPIGNLVLLPALAWLLIVGAFGFFGRRRRVEA